MSVTMLLFVCIVYTCLGLELLPGLGNMAKGYNIFTGNPSEQKDGDLDPGYTTPIFNTSKFKSNTVHGYGIPIGFTVTPSPTCSEQESYTYKCVTDILTYQQTLSDSVSGSVGFPGLSASFSVSSTFQETYSETSQQKSVYASTKSKCTVYDASLEGTPGATGLPPFTENFMGQVQQLPTTYSSSLLNSKFAPFFGGHGTHYIQSGDMGGYYGYNYQMEYYKYSQYQSSNFDVETSAQLLGKEQIGVSLNSSSEKQQASDYEGYTENKIAYNVGGTINPSGDFNKWYNSLFSQSAFIKLNIKPIYELLTKAQFPKDSQITEKQNALKTALGNYCNWLVNNNVKHYKNIICSGSYPRYNQPPNSIFGGIFTQDNNNGNDPYTNKPSCIDKSDYSPYPYFNVGYESQYGFYMCLNKTQVNKGSDALGTFGGFYYINPQGGGCQYGNPLLSKGSNVCKCPSGYVDYIQISWYNADHVHFEGHYCYASKEHLGTKMPIAGLFQTGHIVSNNYYTGGQSCYGGYTAYLVASGITCDGAVKNGTPCSIYACINNVQQPV